jgi:hypothetical protein
MKLLLVASAALVVTGFVVAQPAEARCYWNGYERVCVHHSYREYDESTVRYYGPPLPPYEPPPYVEYYTAPAPAPWAYGPPSAWAYDWYQ